MLKIFEPNTKGRDFVIGDLHGMHSLLIKLLEHIKFDAACDRMFSVGDLVDRGEDSLSCLRLLDQPWFHPVMANHELMTVAAFNGGEFGAYWLQNGGRWGLDALVEFFQAKQSGADLSSDTNEIHRLVQKAGKLPTLITVKLKSGKRVHIVHAEFPFIMDITDQDLEDPAFVSELANIAANANETDFLWSRRLFGQFAFQDLSDFEKIERTVKYRQAEFAIFNPNLSHIISGHTPVQKPLTLIGQTCIDTNAYGAKPEHDTWKSLTCIELGTWSFVQVNHQCTRHVDPIVINMT